MSTENFLKSAKEIKEKHKSGENNEQQKKMTVAHDESNWLVSYADLMTLLCGFFVMMFSMATVNVPKYKEITKEIAKAFGGAAIEGEGGTEKTKSEGSTPHLENFFVKTLQDIGLERGARVTTDSYGVNIVVESAVFFESGSAEISQQGKAIIKKLGSTLQERQSQEERAFKMIVEGHTDQRPSRSLLFPSNWELSSARASSVVRLFEENGFLSDQLMAVGFGDSRVLESDVRSPAGEWNEKALEKNRRVVIRILHPTTEFIPWNSDPGTPAAVFAE